MAVPMNPKRFPAITERGFGLLRLAEVDIAKYGEYVPLENEILFGKTDLLFRGDGVTPIKNLVPLNRGGGGGPGGDVDLSKLVSFGSTTPNHLEGTIFWYPLI